MEIRELRPVDLERLLEDRSFWKSEKLPVSRRRALSQANNPRARKDDILLLAAYEGEKLAGFLGMLPDTIAAGDAVHKFCWLSTWWVAPEFRSTGIGAALLLRALELYDGKVAVASFTEQAKKIYDATRKFMTLRERTMHLFVLKIDPALLLGFLDGRNILVPVALRAAAPFVNSLMRIRRIIWDGRLSDESGFRCVELADIDKETEVFIRGRAGSELFHRGSAEIEWIVQYPWVGSDESDLEEARRYEFTAYAKSALYRMLRLNAPDGRIVGFALLHQMDGHTTVPCLYHDEPDLKGIAAALAAFIVDSGTSVFSTRNSALALELRNSGMPFIREFRRRKDCIVSKGFPAGAFDGLQMHDGVGDIAFT